MTKLSIELAKSALLKEDEAKKVKVQKLALSSNRKPKEVGKPKDLSGKVDKVKQIEVPAGGKPKSGNSSSQSFGTSDRADAIVSKMKRVPKQSTAKNEKSPSVPSVKQATKPNQNTKMREIKGSTIKNAEEGKTYKTSMPQADYAASYVDSQPKGSKNMEVKSDGTPTVKAPKAKDLGQTTRAKGGERKANFAAKDGKKVDQIKHTGKFSSDPADAPKKVTYNKETNGAHNVVESGVVVSLNGKKKATFGVVSRSVLNRMVENYERFGYDVSVSRTDEAAWKKDAAFLKLLREAIDAKHNFVGSVAKESRKAALKRFATLVKNDYNNLYESRGEFTRTIMEAFSKIEKVAERKYLANLEIFECIARVTNGDDIIDAEIVTEATGPQMALRQVRKKVAEEIGLGAEIKHVFVDGKKYLTKNIEEWTKK